MGARTHRTWAGVAVAASLACSHAPVRPAGPPPAVVWPAPPAAPRLRLVAVIPSPDAPPPRRSFWRRALELLVGTSPEERAASALVRPFGVAVATDGTVYVADPDLPGVVRAGPAGEIEAVTCRGRDWAAPMAVALGPDGALWVADAGAAEVVLVPADRRCRAVGAGVLERPTGVALHGGRVFVSDPPQHALAIFAADGALEARVGTAGSGEGQLHFPTSVSPASGGLLVVDALNFRIVRVTGGGAAGAAFGEPGEERGALARPKGVAEDAAGRVYVTDAQRDRILVYDGTGAFQYAAGETGDAPGSLQHPAGIAVHGDRLYVADSQNARVQVFEILGGSS